MNRFEGWGWNDWLWCISIGLIGVSALTLLATLASIWFGK